MTGSPAPSPDVLARRPRQLRARPYPDGVPVHHLKTTPGTFQAIWMGDRTFEIRYDDRGYQRDDNVILHEYDSAWHCTCDPGPPRTPHHPDSCEKYTGRQITAVIGVTVAFVPQNGRRGYNGDGYLVLSLLELTNHDGT